MRDRTRGWASFLAALAALCACATDEFPTDDVSAPVCHTVVTTAEIATTNIDKTDVLFVVDDGPSMVEEQATLGRELPRLIELIANGGNPDGWAWPHVREVHVGIVSTDMGAGGDNSLATGCTAWGDDGLLQRMNGCVDGEPSFLSYTTVPPLGAPPDSQAPAAFAAEVACSATLGTSGCGYAQPLEAALKALWPSMDVDPDGVPFEPNRILFLGRGADALGRGDRENAGFLRNDPVQGISLVSIVVVTDKDDCSATDGRLFEDVPVGEAPDTRCAEGQDSLYRLERYVAGLQALRPGNENMVTFSAITGVPPDLVTEEAWLQVDTWDPVALRAYYDGILADPRMQYARQPDGSLAPACQSEHARTTPARRLVQVAHQFGESGRVLSLCDGDWSPALAQLTDSVETQRGAICLPRALPRDANGFVDCDVVWELPPPGQAPAGTPESCDEAPALLQLNRAHPVSERGGFVCKMHQLAVTGAPDAPAVEPGYGWYYDDFSDVAARDCSAATPQLISFSDAAEPLTGVAVKVECRDTRYVFPASGELARAWQRPEVFEACDPEATESCDRPLQDAEFHKVGVDRALYCHPELRQCVPACTAGACPEGWQCNSETPAWCEPLECHVPG